MISGSTVGHIRLIVIAGSSACGVCCPAPIFAAPNPEDNIAARGMNSSPLGRGLEHNHRSSLRGARNMVLLH
jgi:hypothetical protein